MNRLNIRNKEIIILFAVFLIFIAAFLIIFNLGVNPLHNDENEKNEIKTIKISGSTTIQPVSELLATAWMDKNPDINILVKGGGSGAGVSDAALGLSDIGSASRNLDKKEKEEYSGLNIHQIGGSAIVIIVPVSSDISHIKFEEAASLYNGINDDVSGMENIADIKTTIQRSDASGTEETFSKWLFNEKNLNSALQAEDTSKAGIVEQIAAEGNIGVLSAVKDNPDSIGFVDFGYAEFDPGVRILKIRDMNSSDYLPKRSMDIREAILNELKSEDDTDKSQNNYYIGGLTRPLNYITGEEQKKHVADFIEFAKSDEAAGYFHEIGYFSVTEIK